MQLALFKKNTEVKKTPKKKKRFSLKRKLLSWSITTILIMSAVMLIKRGFGTLIPGGAKGLFRKKDKKKK